MKIDRHNGVKIIKGSATNLSTKLQKLDFKYVSVYQIYTIGATEEN